MNYTFKDKADTSHYTADAFVVRCFDNRFWKPFKHFVKELNLKHIDVESVAGGAKIFATPEKEGDKDFMLRELEKSIRLHHTKKVILFTHSDCGAYGSLSRFGDDKSLELEFHAKEHETARAVIHERFPEMPIESYFVDEEGIKKLK
jgi:carbonic anhydrase